MAPTRRKTASIVSTQKYNAQHHHASVYVPTPQIEVSLVDRMRKRFSTRNPTTQTSSDDTSDENEISPVHSLKKGSQKKSSLGQKVTLIDKVFSPEKSSSRVFRSPTRFPTRTPAEVAASTSESEDRGTNVDTREKELSVIDQIAGESQMPVDDSVEEMISRGNTGTKRKGDGLEPSTSRTKKKRADSAMNPNSKTRETSAGIEEKSKDTRDQERFSLDGCSSGDKTKKGRPKQKGPAVIACGEMNSHMADKEFIGSQVRVVSSPFVLESGPRSWMQLWKSQQLSNDTNLTDIPQSVIDRVVTKINFRMDEVYQRNLGREQQRNTLMSLDKLRRDSKNQTQNTLHTGVQDQASLQEIISCYPIEWPGDVEKDDDPLKERYASLRAKLFALSSSLSVTMKQHEQYTTLAESLKGIDSNVKKYPFKDLKEEIKRTLDLVSQIREKLQTETLRDECTSSFRDDSIKKTSTPIPLKNHSALIKMLFRAAATRSTKPP